MHTVNQLLKPKPENLNLETVNQLLNNKDPILSISWAAETFGDGLVMSTRQALLL